MFMLVLFYAFLIFMSPVGRQRIGSLLDFTVDLYFRSLLYIFFRLLLVFYDKNHLNCLPCVLHGSKNLLGF